MSLLAVQYQATPSLHSQSDDRDLEPYWLIRLVRCQLSKQSCRHTFPWMQHRWTLSISTLGKRSFMVNRPFTVAKVESQEPCRRGYCLCHSCRQSCSGYCTQSHTGSLQDVIEISRFQSYECVLHTISYVLRFISIQAKCQPAHMNWSKIIWLSTDYHPRCHGVPIKWQPRCQWSFNQGLIKNRSGYQSRYVQRCMLLMKSITKCPLC